MLLCSMPLLLRTSSLFSSFESTESGCTQRFANRWASETISNGFVTSGAVSLGVGSSFYTNRPTVYKYRLLNCSQISPFPDFTPSIGSSIRRGKRNFARVILFSCSRNISVTVERRRFTWREKKICKKIYGSLFWSAIKIGLLGTRDTSSVQCVPLNSLEIVFITLLCLLLLFVYFSLP